MSVNPASMSSHSSRQRRAFCSAAVLAAALVVGMSPAADANRNHREPVAGADAVGSSPHTTDAVVNSGWRRFFWDGHTITLITFRSTRPTLLTVTDAFCRGDVFRLWDGQRLVGDTSGVPADGCAGPAIERPWRALQDDSYSHGSFVLRPGMHVIRLRAVVNPYHGGGAFFRLDSPGQVWGVLRAAQASGH